MLELLALVGMFSINLVGLVFLFLHVDKNLTRMDSSLKDTFKSYLNHIQLLEKQLTPKPAKVLLQQKVNLPDSPSDTFPTVVENEIDKREEESMEINAETLDQIVRNQNVKIVREDTFDDASMQIN